MYMTGGGHVHCRGRVCSLQREGIYTTEGGGYLDWLLLMGLLGIALTVVGLLWPLPHLRLEGERGMNGERE